MAINSGVPLSTRYLGILQSWITAQERYLVNAAIEGACPKPTVEAPNGQKIDWNDFWKVSCEVIEKFHKLWKMACQQEGADNPKSLLTSFNTTGFAFGSHFHSFPHIHGVHGLRG